MEVMAYYLFTMTTNEETQDCVKGSNDDSFSYVSLGLEPIFSFKMHQFFAIWSENAPIFREFSETHENNCKDINMHGTLEARKLMFYSIVKMYNLADT